MLQAKMKSTCYPAGKAFEASQSHRKLRPICSTCSLAAWVLQYNSSRHHRHHCQHLWKFHLEDSSSGCCWDQLHGASWGPEKTPFQPPPGHSCSGQVCSDYSDFEKDLLEAFSICCPASQASPDCWDSEKDLLEVFSRNCRANRVGSSCWDFEKDLLEVFSICCLARTELYADSPSHRTLQQEAQSNSCFSNTRTRSSQTSHIHLDTMLWCHQYLVWLHYKKNQVQWTCPQGVSWTFGFSGQGISAFWDLQRVLSAFGESSQIKLLHTVELKSCTTCDVKEKIVNILTRHTATGAGFQSSKA